MFNFRFVSVGETLTAKVKWALFNIKRTKIAVNENGKTEVTTEKDDLGYDRKINPSHAKNVILHKLSEIQRPEDLDPMLRELMAEEGNE
jgi:hypothetical protein